MDDCLNKRDNVSVIELNNGQYSAVVVIRINKVPSVESAVAEDKFAELHHQMTGLLTSVHDFMSIEYSVELLLISSGTGNRNTSTVDTYIVLRALDENYSAVEHGLGHLLSVYCNLLDAGNYLYDIVDISYDNVFLQSVNSLNGKCVKTLLKNEYQIPSYSPVTKYYYCSEIIPLGGFGLKEVYSALVNSPGTAVSIQVIPTFFDVIERDSVERVTYLLDQLSKGFYDNVYGNIRDVMAVEPFNYFNYYREHSNMLYIANISVIGSDFTTKSVISQLEQAIVKGDSSESSFVLNNFDLGTEVDYADHFYIHPWILHYHIQDIIDNLPFWMSEDAPRSLHRMCLLHSAEELSKLMTIPVAIDGNIAGIDVNYTSSFETHFKESVFNNDISLGFLRGDRNSEIGISFGDLAKHVFIAGVPGCGKTTLAQKILFDLNKNDIPFLIIEPAKNEYRALIDIIPELQIFTPGKDEISPFMINPFIPPKNVKLITYKGSLMSAFEAAFYMEGPLKSLFSETIESCYAEYGWRDSYTIDDGGKVFGLLEFVKEFKKNMVNKYDLTIRQRMETAGVVRLMKLINDNYFTFDVHNTVPLENLLTNPTLIELNGIENNEQKSLITSLLLVGLFSYTQSNISPDKYGNLNHVLLLEEAHVLLSNNNGKCANESNANNSAVELIERILSEKRASGVSLILADQSPQNVTRNVIKFTGTKVIFRTVDSEDKKLLSQSIDGIGEEDFHNISKLQPGNAYTYFEKIPRAVPVTFDDFREKVDLRDTISDTEVKDRNTYWIKNVELSKPFSDCKYNKYCSNGCDFYIRAEARYLASLICKKFDCNDSFTNKQFINMIKEVNSIIEENIDSTFNVVSKDKVRKCTKIELLRKIFLITKLNIKPEIKDALLNSNKF